VIEGHDLPEEPMLNLIASHTIPLSVGAPLPTVAEGEVSRNGASPEGRSC
jgi:hypothetical protein